jgi:tape measure domain-containing protein
VATVDDRVVSMSFENSKFASGVHSTLALLERLKKSLQFPNAGKGLEGINAAANRTDLSHIGRGIDELKSKFTALKVAGVAVLANLATSAIQHGAQFVKSFTFQPIMAGLHEYETNLNSVQTILANTQASGAKLKDVNAALQELNTYSDKTIYNFSEMAKNIGTFTAAGVDLKTSTASIKGIANLAALSGSNSQQASTAMYQLSQAIASGRVSLQDWNSVVNAGMGGTVFQRALAQTAEKMGTLSDGAVTLKGKMKNVSIEGKSFRESIQAGPGKKSWLTSDVLTKTLQQFTGDLTDAQLKAEGFNAAEIEAIQAQAKTAMNAATQVKTLGQVFDVAKETMGSGWAQTFQTIFGDFGEAKTTFTALSNVINGFINTNSAARNKVLGDWKALGGRAILITGIKNAFHDLVAVIKPIKDAFRDIFPPKTGKDLLGFTKGFERLTERLRPSPQTVENLRRTFRGFFAVLDIGKQIVGGIFSVIGKLFGTLGKGSGGFLNLTGSIGDFLVSVDEALKKGGRLHHFFDTLGDVIATPIALLKAFVGAIASAFSGAAIGKAGQSLGPLQKIIEGVTKAWDNFLGSVGRTQEIAQPALDGLSHMFGALGQSIADALQGANFDAIFKVLEVGLLGGIFLTLKKTLSGGLGNALAGGVLKSIVQAFAGVGGLSRSIGGTFNALTGSIQTMQQNVKSDTLKNIAISIALLSASIIGLSLVDPKRLNRALTAITIGFAQLLGAMAIMDKIGKSGGFIKMPFIAASMILLATAIDLLAIAVYSLSKLSWEQLAKGLGAVSVLLIGISAASGPLSANSAGMIRAGAGITIIAIALNILARAIASFGNMSMTQLAKGIVGVSIALVGIGLAAKTFPSGMVAIGVGLIAVGTGLRIISGSIQKLGGMNMNQLAKGIGAIAASLVVIGLAMRTMPGPSMLITAAGLVLVAIALKSIGKTVGSMGGMSVEQLAKGLISLALSLTILTVALYAMEGAIGGAAALAVAAAGLALLAPALKSLGAQSWTQIIKGLVALAAAFVLLGVAGVVLAPVAPAILALGVALIAVGAGLALAGAGVALIGVGLAAIAVAGPAAVKILVDALVKLAAALPKVVQGLVNALVGLVTSLAQAAPKFVQALGQILVALANAIIAAAPGLTKAFTAILQLIFKVIRDNFPGLVRTGFEMLRALLQGISNNIGSVVRMVVTIIAKILSGVANSLGKVVTAGGTILLAILKGIANNIGKVLTTTATIIAKFVAGIGNNLGKIATAGLSILTRLLNAIANNIGKAINAGTNIVVNIIRGIGNAGPRIVTAGVNAITKFIRAVSNGAVKLVDEGARAIVRFLNGVADAINAHEGEMIHAGGRIGAAIVQGMINGVGSLAGSLSRKVGSMIAALPKKAAKLLGIGSPSKVFHDMGQYIVLGLANGMGDSSAAVASAESMGVAVIDAFKDTFEITSPSKVMNDIGQYVGQGFAQGLTKSGDDIKKSFTDLNNKLTDAMVNARATIKREQDKLDRLRRAKHRDASEIRQTQAVIRQNQDLLNRSNAGHILLVKTLTKEKLTLQGLAKDYANIAVRLDDAKKALEEATKTRDDAVRSFSDQYATLPDIVTTDAEGNAIDQLVTYEQALANQAAAVGAYQATLDQLRALGLDDATYQKLLKEGTADQQFATQLLSGGKTAVDGLNALDAQLMSVSQTLATNAAHNLYQAGVDAAQGLVNGIASQQATINQMMVNIANSMVRAIKKKLKIKSPSEIFADIGRQSTEGMAKGLTDSAKVVTDAVSTVADGAVAAMKTSLTGISDAITEHIDPNPTITPVLDLTDVQNGAKSLDNMLNVIPITAAASFGQASTISADENAAQAAAAAEQAIIKFEQNNYSPESLSSIEIYRQTKNQLAQARPVLAT